MSRADRRVARAADRAQYKKLMKLRRQNNRLYDTYGTSGSSGLQFGQWLTAVADIKKTSAPVDSSPTIPLEMPKKDDDEW